MEKCAQIVKIINEGKTSIFHRLQSFHITNCSIEHVNGSGDIPTVILRELSRVARLQWPGKKLEYRVKVLSKDT